MKPNFKNRTIWTGDNLDILRGMNSESVDLIYLDPPFNSNRTYEAPIGSKAAGAKFKDAWTLSDVDMAWHGEIADKQPALYAIIDAAGLSHSTSMKSYLIMMGVRLLEMERILKVTGSIYLHCDPTASHYLKMLMDSIFRAKNFRNEIVWCYSGGGIPKKDFPRKHDTVLRYSKSGEYAYSPAYRPYSQGTVQRGRTAVKGVYHQRGLRPEGTPVNDWWPDVPKITSPTDFERTGYPTQKPLALLDRIIRASSNVGDIVLDPFCGCATACIAAEKSGRQWAGVDLSELAAKLVVQRADKEIGGLFKLHHRTDIPKRTDQGKIPSYRTHKHTLFGKQEGKCIGCKVLFPFRNFTVDHVVAKSRGGTDHIDNLQLLCGACNSMKGSKTQEEFLVEVRNLSA